MKTQLSASTQAISTSKNYPSKRLKKSTLEKVFFYHRTQGRKRDEEKGRGRQQVAGNQRKLTAINKRLKTPIPPKEEANGKLLNKQIILTIKFKR